MLLAAVAVGPWLARVSVRLAARDETALPSGRRIAVTTLALVALLAAVLALSGLRPATVGLAWTAAAGLVLGAVDLAVHRLPDRVTFPACAAVAAALLVDAAVLGTWPALLRAVLAAGAAFGLALLAALLSPEGLGFGDVKLLALLGLVLGWVGWGALLAGVFLGLLTGALVSLALVAGRRAGWRTALPFGPPLLVGAALALALEGPVPLG
ncbi:prepilin peptidase [Geodermatophilus ruber]|uniref:Leader peptidase (Prepilin peptidase) / N-methyltransferase n=1 Tax=Geodermatophilus ruber TaxID=504800 RepID=A0A1I4FEW2_9ACTN|nr:prepilin peptidase [Geodermatophilus ruber]SFL16468.1 leader peptidase (prepilin peptidase) / N-methyltransferase [Geodermatophilus ruber]